jgi:hypothetical protein
VKNGAQRVETVEKQVRAPKFRATFSTPSLSFLFPATFFGSLHCHRETQQIIPTITSTACYRAKNMVMWSPPASHPTFTSLLSQKKKSDF